MVKDAAFSIKMKNRKKRKENTSISFNIIITAFILKRVDDLIIIMDIYRTLILTEALSAVQNEINIFTITVTDK